MTVQVQAQALLIPRPEAHRADDPLRSDDDWTLRGFDDIFEEKQSAAREASPQDEAEASEESAAGSSTSESRVPDPDKEHEQEGALKRASASGIVPHDVNAFLDRPITIHAFNQRLLNAGSSVIEGAVAAQASEVRTGRDGSKVNADGPGTVATGAQETESGPRASASIGGPAGHVQAATTDSEAANATDRPTNGANTPTDRRGPDLSEQQPGKSPAKSETVSSQGPTSTLSQQFTLWNAGAPLTTALALNRATEAPRESSNQSDAISSPQSNKGLTPALELSPQSQRGRGNTHNSSDRRDESAAHSARSWTNADDPSNLREDGTFVAQVTRGLSEALKRSEGTTILRLQPHALGQLRIDVRDSEQGVLARFQASSDQARRLLESSMSTLRSALEARGVVVDQLHVETVQPVLDSAEPSSTRKPDAPSARAWSATGPGTMDPAAEHPWERTIGDSIRAEHGSELGGGRDVAPSWLGEPEIEAAADEDWLTVAGAERQPSSVESESGPETAMPRALDARRAYRPGILLALGIDWVA